MGMATPSDSEHSDENPGSGKEARSSRQVADLLQVLEISRQLAIATDLTPLLQGIETAALSVLDCERATVYLHDAEADELVSRVATGVKEIRFPSPNGIAGECFHRGDVINVPDAYADSRFNRSIDVKTGFRTRNMLNIPLVAHDQQRIGVLQVLNKRTGGFGSWDETLAKTLSAQCGVAIERHTLLEEFAKKQRIERDLKIARSIQQGLLPSGPPELPGFSCAGFNRPAEETGGDFYTWQMVSGGRFVFTIADVTGHGMGASLVAAQCHALLRATFSAITDQTEVTDLVMLLNRLLSEDLPVDRFVTLFCGLLDPATSRLSYTSAGHGPLLLFRAETGEVERLGIHGMPLGVDPNEVYQNSTEVFFEEGDVLSLFTDGLFEWKGPDNERYGEERFCQVVQQNPGLGPSDLIARSIRSLRKFAGATPQADDLTAVVLRRDPHH